MNAVLQYTVQGLAAGSFYALAALGLAVIFGVLGVVNFAHGAFYMLGVTGAQVFTYAQMPNATSMGGNMTNATMANATSAGNMSGNISGCDTRC